MKSQDVVLMLKLVSLERPASGVKQSGAKQVLPEDWRGWTSDDDSVSESESPVLGESYSARALEQSTGISKSEVSLALRRCSAVGLVRADRQTGLPRVNARVLLEFIVYGLKYVFPAKLGAPGRGIPTTHAAPVLSGRLLAAGNQIFVWADPNGTTQGQRIELLYRTVPRAVRWDAGLYAMLALVDSIRIGHAREVAMARDLLGHWLVGGND